MTLNPDLISISPPALENGSRAVLRGADSPDETYYGGFFDSNTLFIHSNEWVEAADFAAPIPEERVAPMPAVSASVAVD